MMCKKGKKIYNAKLKKRKEKKNAFFVSNWGCLFQALIINFIVYNYINYEMHYLDLLAFFN